MQRTEPSELRRLRLRRGLWLKDVACGTLYTVSHLSNVERGRQSAGRKLVAALADFYDMPPGRMLGICRRTFNP